MKSPRKILNKVQKVIASLLKENTGIHFLDSGSAYGRAWQRNQNRRFLDEPAYFVEAASPKDIRITLNIFWFLSHSLDITPESIKLDRKLRRTLDDNYSLDDVEKFLEEVHEPDSFIEVDARMHNTYNGDSMLSQIIQFAVFNNQGEHYILLQIHGGCDARGGYTYPKVFALKDYFEFILALCDVYASDGSGTWDSSNCGYSFYNQEDETSLEDVAIVVEGNVYNKYTGERFMFGGPIGGDNSSEEPLYEISLIDKFIKENYSDSLLQDKLEKEFPNVGKEMLSEMYLRVIREIESNTLELLF